MHPSPGLLGVVVLGGCAAVLGIDNVEPTDGGAESSCPTGSPLFQDDFEADNSSAWESPDGCTGITFEVDGTRVLSEVAPNAMSECDRLTTTSLGDFDLTVLVKTIDQLGSPPNAYNVGGIVWHVDNRNFYYVLLKPNGWELDKKFACATCPGGEDTKYLATGNSPSFALNVWHRARVKQVGNAIEVWADDAMITSVTDNDMAYLSGPIGLDTAAAHAHFDDLLVCSP